MERVSSNTSWIAAADLVRVDQQDLVDELAAETEGFFAHPLHRHAIGEDADAIERHALAGTHGFVHRGRVIRLHADDLHVRVKVFHVHGDAADEPATADGHENGVWRRAGLAKYLDGDGALARDHVRVVESVHEHEIALALQLHGVLIRGVVLIPVQHDFATERPHRLHFDFGRGLRHDDGGRNASLVGGKGHALCVIAGGSADHSTFRGRFGQVRNLVVRAAQLEREDGLQILALQQHRVAETARQARGRLERRLDRHVIDTRLENPLDIGTRHTHSRKRLINGCSSLAILESACRLRHTFRSPGRHHIACSGRSKTRKHRLTG